MGNETKSEREIANLLIESFLNHDKNGRTVSYLADDYGNIALHGDYNVVKIARQFISSARSKSLL